MFGVRRKRLDLEHQNQDQRWGEKVDTEVKRDIPGMQTFSTLMQSMSAARKASKSPPCSSGKSASSEPGGPWNKGSLSCLQAISSGTQSMTAELAQSKDPASRCNKVHPARYHNKHRCEHVRDRVLNGSTHGEANKQTQSQDILKRKNKMKHLFSKTNIEEIIDSERLSSAETLGNFLGGTTTVPHLSTFDILSSETEEEEGDDGVSASWQDTYRESDWIPFPRTVSQSSSASTTLSHSAHSLHSLQSFSSQLSTSTTSGEAPDGYSLTPFLEQPPVAPPPPTTDRVSRGLVALWQHLPKLQISWRTSQTSLASSPRSSFCQRHSTLVNREEDAVQKGTSTTDTLQSSNETCGPSASGQLDNKFGDIEEPHIQECQEAQGGATATQNAQSLKDSNKEIVCRPKRRLLFELSNEEEEDQCRICHSGGGSPTNPLLSPCLCSGSMQFIHLDCLKKWIQTKIQSGSRLHVVKRCELCMGGLTLDPNTFDLDDYYRRHHEQQQVDMTELYNLQEVAEVLSFRSLLSRSLLPAMVTPSWPVPRIRIWALFPYQMRMRLRRIRERNSSPETTVT
ncbi:probable E3 ubiquitin-protein ligase MARCHF10 [Siniperca chuatsi]|uniref:probable E3 ubiquitin-protein ligase MARCHF10 n=1 Tax=Siniperca chuatsi TaxID=119488 RepID=UPI001CE1B99C|nr:probable E3 ubiquitin-protein ligase MARCHF10 [Siniperca chuatsi]